MDAKNNNINEIQEIAPLVAGIGNQNLYFVPEGYFELLSESVMTHLKLAQLKGKNNPFTVPDGYFEGLADSILNRIHNEKAKTEVYEELSEVAPLLNKIDKTNIFAVPENYFENIPVPVRLEKKPGKIISLGSSVRKWVTYAAAASVLFIISTTSYLYVTIHGKTIEKHLPIEQRIAELNEDEIINYLKDNDVSTGDVIPAANEDPEIQHMLQKVSDEEIENYLDDNDDTNEKPIKGI